ncbi:MAG: C4-dicarboxylate TRAP transporter substrate-binding protein [Candidatus Accumulibacter sp.]|jgi:tripartite ATP-independent transporter DctP family solute receptor|nr:C4-dicarboxylate TRAP transporter substrate-binding protein [Accumulibacter sp.]
MKSVLLKTFLVAGLATLAIPAFAAKYTLSVNTALTTNDPLYKGLESFRDAMAKRSNGELEVKLFPNSQLGPDDDVLEQARAGAPVAVVSDGGRLSAFVQEFGVLSAPYIAPGGYDGIRKVVTSPLLDEWAAKLAKASGHQVLSFNWWQGERELWTQSPVKTPADLKGNRMRTIGAPIWLESIRAMGATPTPMPWAEVYSALEQKVIDSVEAQLPAGYGSKLQEVTRYLTKTHHIHLISGLITSAQWFNSLPPDLQKALREESLKAGDVASFGTRDNLEQITKNLAAAGMTVVEDVDLTPFKEATEGIYGQFGYGELRKKIQEIVDAK